MAETYRFPTNGRAWKTDPRLLYSSITEKSAPRGIANAAPRFSATFGIGKEDFDEIVQIMVNAIKVELGSFTDPRDYFLACMSGTTAGKRAIEKAEFDCTKPDLTEDEKFKIREKANKRAELYKPYAGIVTASSNFDIELARLEPTAGGSKIIDIANEPVARAQAGKDLFYPGAYVAPSLAFKAFRRKTLDAKDGVTCYLQNALFLRKGERLGGSGGPANNEVFGGYAHYSDYDPTANAPSNSDTEEPAF